MFDTTQLGWRCHNDFPPGQDSSVSQFRVGILAQVGRLVGAIAKMASGNGQMAFRSSVPIRGRRQPGSVMLVLNRPGDGGVTGGRAAGALLMLLALGACASTNGASSGPAAGIVGSAPDQAAALP